MEFPEKKRIRIGKNVRISVDKLHIGDGVLICDNVTIEGPEVSIGDYTVIRENTQILGKSPVSIGMCCWIGQGCILDATDRMTIGDGVGIGAHSQLWTHIRFGDPVEGCLWNSTKPMLIEDDVWFVGHCLVSPIHAKKKSMAMLGSVVSKDMTENHIYAGIPAKDITEKIGPQYKIRSVDEKYQSMVDELNLFAHSHDVSGRIQIVKDWPADPSPEISYFNVATRQYTKILSEIEIDFMLHLLMLIKFYPLPLQKVTRSS
jgi:acetyltransferase-like isoleucine patch superfamily enzyme